MTSRVGDVVKAEPFKAGLAPHRRLLQCRLIDTPDRTEQTRPWGLLPFDSTHGGLSFLSLVSQNFLTAFFEDTFIEIHTMWQDSEGSNNSLWGWEPASGEISSYQTSFSPMERLSIADHSLDTRQHLGSLFQQPWQRGSEQLTTGMLGLGCQLSGVAE